MKFDRAGLAGDYSEPIRKLDAVTYELRKLRYTQGVSQRELARRMGYSRNALAHAEAGVTSPTFAFMLVWAEALGVQLMVKS